MFPSDGNSISSEQGYIGIINTEQHPTDNGVYRPDPGLYRFYLKSYSDPAILDELGYYDFLLDPTPDNTLKITPLLNGANFKTIYKFEYTF